MNEHCRALFFDLGGTLRIARHDEAYERTAREKMAKLSGTPLSADDFYALVERRYEPYRDWALTANRESGDEELWRKWLTPDLPAAVITKNCHELTFQYRQSKGVRTLVDGGLTVLRELKARGYKLAIISNLIGENEIPDWLRADGLTDYFSSVVLSSVCHIRKPDPEVYRMSAREMGLTPWDCASVADNLGRDITGAREAGVGMCILFRSPEKKHKIEITDANRPDRIIDRFTELLDILPPLGGAK